MSILVPPSGPIPAKVMIVGEAPGSEEEKVGAPFVGASGLCLDKMLQEAGIHRHSCFVTNVCKERPPNNDISYFIAAKKKDITNEHKQFKDKWVKQPVIDGISLLRKEIEMVNPNIIIALGNTPLWALTSNWGITKWRGSMLVSDLSQSPGVVRRVVPTIHPASVLREWSQRAYVVQDLRRAARFMNGQAYPKPDWHFTISPSFISVKDCLDKLYVRANHAQLLRLSFDLETRGGHIACAGIAWSLTEAICIPFVAGGLSPTWSEDQEAEILWKMYLLLTHPNVRVIGQNLLYDCQYTWKWWGYVPNVDFDTMIGQHACFSALPKNLGFIASMYCNYYVYWKDEGKNI